MREAKKQNVIRSRRGLTSTDLNQMRCMNVDCGEKHEGDGLWISASCHPSGGLDVCYADGSVYLCCKTCNAHVTKIEVAL